MKHINDRGVEKTYFTGQHLTLYDLKKENIEHGYLYKNIPDYPEFLDFTVNKVSHVTGRCGLEGIFQDLGFRSSETSNLLWWDLSVTADDIRSAEQRFLTSLFPRTRIRNQLPFLDYFTTSKAFQKSSPYGNFRFTFSIKELLYHYGDQFCHGQSPVLRVYETALYRQEIVYAIIVHPRYIKCYDDYPRLPNDGDGVCGYTNGSVWWRCQAPSETHKHRLDVNWKHCNVLVQPCNKQFYVWDHVCVAFHMEPGWVLQVDQDKIFNRPNVCEVSYPCLLKPPETPLSLDEAENILRNLKARMGYAGSCY